MKKMLRNSKDGKKGKMDSNEKRKLTEKTKMPGFQGNLYQSKLLMLYLHRGLSSKYEYTDFELGTEIEEADKFDDLVFKYKKNVNGQEQDHFILLQAKHKSETNSKITYEEIFTDGNVNFGMVKYFNAFKKAKNHETFKDGVIEHVIIHTNANFNMFGIIPEKNRISNNLKYISNIIKEVKAEPNSVLSLSKVGGGKYYQFKSDLVLPILKPMLSDYYKIAQTLIKFLKEGKNLPLDGFLKKYNCLLTTEVIDMNTMSFRDDFWNEKYDNTEGDTGRQKLKSALDKVINDEKLNKDEIFKIKFKIENIGQQCNSQKWPADESDEDIRKYLETLVFAVDQPNEIELQKIILSEIDEKYKQYEADFVYSYFCIEIQRWMKGEIFDVADSDASDCRFISSKSAKEFFKMTKQKFDRKVLKGPTNDYDKFIDLGCFNSVNSELGNPIRDFLSSEKHMLNIVGEEIIISSIKVYNELMKIGNVEITYLRLSSSNESSIDLVIEAFESELTNHLLVIESDLDQIKPNVSEKSIEYLFFRIIDVIQNNRKKKIITISKEEDTLVNNLESVFSTDAELKKIKDNKNLQINFSEDSQILFLNTPINFQGFKVKLSDVINSDDLENIKNQEILLKILKNEEISIGKPINGLQNMQNYYVNRKFIYEIKSEKNLYLLSNINEKDLCDSSVVRKLKVNNEYWKNSLTNDESEIFNRSAKENNSINIYLLRQENNVLNLLKQSKDPINVTDFEKTVSYESNCEINLISAIAGMGKSTLFTNLSRKIKEQNHKLWVIKVDLNDVSTKLKEIKNSGRVDDQTAIDFLHCSAKIVSELEISIFECHLLRRNVVLYLDGFDEICPDYKEVTLEIIVKLENITKIKEIWISTRPYNSILNYAKALFKNMFVKRYEIEPFTENNQKYYLNNFWKETIDINIKFFNNFVTKLFYLLKNNIEDKRMEFLGVALHTNMIAVTFKDTFKKFQDNADLSKSYEKELVKMLQLSKLYESFVKSKYAFYFENKANLKLDTVVAKNMFEELYKESTVKHKLLALDFIYNENQLEIFLTAKELKHLETYKNEMKEKESKEGIVNRIINGKTHFVHRTFAEFFVASFFVENLTKETEKSKTIVEYFLNNMINGDNSVIYKFVNSMLEEDNISQCIINYDVVQNLEKRTIHCVLENNFQNIAKFLIAQGVNLNYPDQNKSVLYLASALRSTKEKEKSILKLIVEKLEMNKVILKEMLCSKGPDGNTPLFLAVKHGILDNIKTLVDVCQKYKVLYVILEDVNNRKECILHLAAENSCEKSLHYLLDLLKNEPETLKALLVKKNRNGNNPFAIAAWYGKSNNLQAILAICNELEIVDAVLANENMNSENVLHPIAGEYIKYDVFVSLLSLLKSKKDILKTLLTKKDRNGNNPFTLAVLHQQFNKQQAILAICNELKITDTVLVVENTNGENILHQTAGKYFDNDMFIHLLGLLKSEPDTLRTLLIKKDRNGNNPFAIAVLHEQFNKQLDILATCNNLNITDSVLASGNMRGENVLHQTAGKNFKDGVFIYLLGLLKSETETLKTLLIEKDRNGDNPFAIAVLYRQFNNLKAILAISNELKIIQTVVANENTSGENVLHQTAGKDFKDGLYIYLLGVLKTEKETLKKFLIKKDRNGNNPFTIAVLHQQFNKLQAILAICNELKIIDTVLLNENLHGVNVLHQTAGNVFKDSMFISLLDLLKSRPEILKILLIKRDQNGENAFAIAVLHRQFNNVKAILAISNELKIVQTVVANENTSGENVLHQTAGKDFKDALYIYLLDVLKTEKETLKSFLIKKDRNGNNPFTITVLHQQFNKLQVSLAICIELKIIDNVLVNENSRRENFLHQTAGNVFDNSIFISLLDLLKSEPATLRTLLINKDRNGNNPFAIAVLHEQFNKIQAILAICNELKIVGIILENENTNGENILHQTAGKEFKDGMFISLLNLLKSEPEILKTLLIKKDEDGYNPFARAALKGQSNNLQAILAIGHELEIIDTVLAKEYTNDETVLHQTAVKDLKNGVFVYLLNHLKTKMETLETLLFERYQNDDSSLTTAALNERSNILQAISEICNELKIIDTVLAGEFTKDENVLHQTAVKDSKNCVFVHLLNHFKTKINTLKILLFKRYQNDSPINKVALHRQFIKLKAILEICDELKILETVFAFENTNVENVLYDTASKDFKDDLFIFLLDLLKSEPETLKTLLIKKDQKDNNLFAIAMLNEQSNKLRAILTACNELKITDIVFANENTNGENILHQTAEKDFKDGMFISLLDLLKSEPEILNTLLMKRDQNGDNPFAIAAWYGKSNNLQALLAVCNEFKITYTVLANENTNGENVLHLTAGECFDVDVFISLLDLLKSEPEILKTLLIKKDQNGYNPFAIAALNGQSNNLRAILAVCNQLKIIDPVIANENTNGENVLRQAAGKDFTDSMFISLLDLLKSEPEILKTLLIKKDKDGNNLLAVAALSGQSNKEQAILAICNELEII